jgi:penicillin-insensitive murein endopeptidase
VRAWSIGIIAGLLAITAKDSAAPAPRTSSVAPPALSIGSPNGGRLDGGARLTEAPYLRVVPFYAESNARWGLPSLVSLLDRAARRVAHQFPDAVLSVGDLSRKRGGELDRHHSHESGRDADVGFYLRSAAKKPLLPDQFVAFSPTGYAKGLPGAVFDDARNWELIDALIDDPVTRVSHVFVAAHIRARLLRYAEQMGVDPRVRERAAEVMMQPRRAPHDDHFHVRIACPKSQHGTCVEEAIALVPRVRPPVAHARRRAGTDRPTKSLPPLGGLAARGDNATDPDYTQTLGEAAGTEEEALPLANASGADTLQR